MQNDASRFLDMLTAARAITDFTRGRTRPDLDADLAFQSAVYWQLCVLGEAAAAVSVQGREAHPSISWRSIIGLRSRLIHGYDSIENDIVWDVAAHFLPPLLAQLEALGIDRAG